MRVFLIWAGKYIELESIISELIKRNHKILYWVGLKDGNELPDCLSEQGTIFHDHFDAWSGVPAQGVNFNEFSPPEKDLIEKMYKTESLVLTMMNKRFDKMCVDERRHLYYNMIGYWHGVIKKYKPEAIIFPIVPHTVYNYIIYELAKMLNIKTVMFEDSWVSDRLLTYTDWMSGSEKLIERMKINKNKNFSINDLSDDLREYYIAQTDASKDSTPIYMAHWKKKFSKMNLFLGKFKIFKKSFLDGTVFKKLFSYIKKIKSNLKKEYISIQTNIDLNKKFVYIPLSFQPERTTSPQGDMFVDQILMIETIASSLPDGWMVCVKEHPSQWWLRSGIRYNSARYPGYYNRIAKIKNVYLAPIETNSFDLINKSQAVATPTGTAGWEALLRSKPALIFGYPWYRDCPSAFRINNTEECKNALNKIVNGYKINQQDIINYLKSFDEATVHGYIESFVDKISKLNHHESMNNITKLILRELE